MSYKNILIFALVMFAGLGACGDQVTNVTYVNEGPTDVRTDYIGVQMSPSSTFNIDVYTTIVGRTTATLADTTIASTSNTSVGSATRISWSSYEGFDGATRQSYVVVIERYKIQSGVGIGEAVITFSSGQNSKIKTTFKVTTCAGNLCKG